MRWLRDGLAAALAFCVVLNVGARLVEHAIPLIVVALLLVSIVGFMVFPNRRR